MWFISLGAGQRTHYEITCPACGCVFSRAIGDYAGSFTGGGSVDIEDLIAATRPQAAADEERWTLALADWAAGRLDDSKRRVVLAELIGSTEYMVRMNAPRGGRESVSALIALAAIACFVGTFISFAMSAAPIVSWSLVAGLVFFGALAIVRGATDMRAAVQTHGLPPIMPALRALNPRRRDLDGAMELLRARSREFAKWVDIRAIERSLQLDRPGAYA